MVAVAAPQEKEAGDFPASAIAAALPLFCNVADDVLYANIKAAIERGHEILYPKAPHGNAALIVGGGPSVRHDVEEIRKRKAEGAAIFALNGSGLWLQRLGIIPDAVIILDARAHNARFVDGLDASVILLLASQCDACVFEAGKEHRIIAWHPSMNGQSGVVEHRPTVAIGGSTTVGMRALRIVHVLGFREAHLFGYDSSYDSSQSHAYPQPENEHEVLRQVEVNGRVFFSPAWMVRQADDFRLIASSLIEEGLALHVHGDGLLPEIARVMGRQPLDHHACYDLSLAPASYDFVQWLVNAEMNRRRSGSQEKLRVAFTEGPLDGFRAIDVQDLGEKRALLDRVMRPMLALFGAVEDDAVFKGHKYHYWYKPVVEAAKSGEAVPRCEVPIATKMAMARWLDRHRAMRPLVITLREARYGAERNSDIAAWTLFAKLRRADGFKVVFVRDTAKADEPIEDFVTCPEASRDLWARAALYSLAHCNFVVSNGPAALLQFSHWPFIEINSGSDTDFYKRFTGLAAPEPLPWHGPHQLTVWQRDTLETIEEAWRRWLQAKS